MIELKVKELVAGDEFTLDEGETWYKIRSIEEVPGHLKVLESIRGSLFNLYVDLIGVGDEDDLTLPGNMAVITR